MKKYLNDLILRWRAVRAMLIYGVLSKTEGEELWEEIRAAHVTN